MAVLYVNQYGQGFISEDSPTRDQDGEWVHMSSKVVNIPLEYANLIAQQVLKDSDKKLTNEDELIYF